jgi:hypothetical protein
MRACFLGENVCALGFGVAIVQTPPLHEPESDPVAASFPDGSPLENLMDRAFRRSQPVDNFRNGLPD